MNLNILLFIFLLFAISCMIVSRPAVFATESNNGNDNKNNDGANSGGTNNDGGKNQKTETKEPETITPPATDSTTTTDVIPIPPPKEEFPLPPIPKVDCKETPNIPPCPPPTEEKLPQFVIPPPVKDVKTQKVDDSCSFFPEQDSCVPDEGQTDCPPGFFTNEDGHCFKAGKCPNGFFRADDDESGTCLPKDKDSPKILCPPEITKNCVDHCPKDTHPEHGLCLANKHNHKVIHIDIRIHKYISHNNNPNSMVTKDTQLTPQLTVGEAIDGCEDVNPKSNNDLQKSCDIFMASTFNYCQTHQSIANKDHNICSDSLYNFVLNYLNVNNVKLKLFPETIYNITP
jgi:hypothetical protein